MEILIWLLLMRHVVFVYNVMVADTNTPTIRCKTAETGQVSTNHSGVYVTDIAVMKVLCSFWMEVVVGSRTLLKRLN